MSPPQATKKRRAQDFESKPTKRPTRQHSLSESEDLNSLSDTDRGSSTSNPDIVIIQPENNESLKPHPETPSVLAKFQTSQDSSANGRDSLGLEDLVVDSTDPIDGFVIDSTITCSLYLAKELRSCPAVDKLLRYNDTSYLEIETRTRDSIKDHYPESLRGRDLYFRIGKCSIVGEDNYENTQVLTSQQDWKKICRDLMNLSTTKNLRTFRLEISQDYFTLQTEVISGEPFANTIRSEIHNLLKSSDGGKYIPRTELNILTSVPMVRRIIFQDTSLELGSDKKEVFVQRVQSDARRLLLMCIYANLGMICLKELLDRGLSDANLPLGDSHQCHDRCAADLDNLVNRQKYFMAAKFLNIGEHQDFPSHVVVPLHYKEAMEMRDNNASNPNSISSYGNNDDGLAKKMAWCGSGAYSNVYRVNIDPDHHRLSNDRNSDFAVKEFKDRPQRIEYDFKRELRALDELRLHFHEHIVTHLASWTHHGRYCMLFPYAECNLRKYMEQVAFGGPENENILWLLKQLRGLAGAIRTIHNLSAIETLKSTSNLVAPTAVQEKKSGWHHDLKPENILYFSRLHFRSLGSKRGILRIGDFGSSRIHTYRSGSVNTKSPSGTPTYEPPEARAEGATSRPYDLWSLGCVSLELLIWAVFGSSEVKDFAEKRYARRYPGSIANTMEDDAFWQMAVDGTVSLRESVKKRIQRLREKVLQPKWQSLKEVLDLVNRMLDLERQTRITALDLWDTLDRIFRQRKLDLKRNNGNSPLGSSQERASSPLPRLSLNAPDRRSPEPPLSPRATPLNTHIVSLANRQIGSISGDFLTSSPIDSPRLSRGRHQRNSSANEL